MNDKIESAPPPVHPVVAMTDEDLANLLRRAVRITVGLGVVVALGLWPLRGWRDALLFAVGAGISVGSLFEWSRLVKLFNARMDRRQTPSGTGMVVVLFLLRLLLFAGVIYGSLKCFRGSPIALVCGLALAIVGLVWEAMRLLRS